MAPTEPEGTRNMKDMIRVSKERPQSQNTKEGFTASKIMSRTPPQAIAKPTPPPGPSKPTNRLPSPTAFTDTEKSESDKGEEQTKKPETNHKKKKQKKENKASMKERTNL